jgi:23S rRNA (adenine2503-C2)-methyltransferase
MLQSNFVINHIKVDTMQRSEDERWKTLSACMMVYRVGVDSNTRTTACVSSQVGCSL